MAGFPCFWIDLRAAWRTGPYVARHAFFCRGADAARMLAAVLAMLAAMPGAVCYRHLIAASLPPDCNIRYRFHLLLSRSLAGFGALCRALAHALPAAGIVRCAT